MVAADADGGNDPGEGSAPGPVTRSRVLALTVVAVLLVTFKITAGPHPASERTIVERPAPVVPTTDQPPATSPLPAVAAAELPPPPEVEEDWTTITTAPPEPTTTRPADTDSSRSAPTTTTTEAASTTAPATDPSGYRSDHEADFFGRISSLRDSSGLASLSRDGSLDARARDWARHIAGTGTLEHSNLGSLIPPWAAASENLGSGDSVASIFEALAASDGHKSAMLGDYTHVGVGVWVDGNGTLWTVHVFTRQ